MLSISPQHQRLVILLQRVALQDQISFNQLHALTAAHLYGVAMRVVRRRELADEVLQEAFLNVWQHAGSYVATLSTPMTWLISIVRNKSLDHLRRHKLENEALMAGDDSTPQDSEDAAEQVDPLERLSVAMDARHLGRCMADLSPAQRQSLALAYYHGMSHAEIACHLQVPVGTAKAWVRRALAHLRHSYLTAPRECRTSHAAVAVLADQVLSAVTGATQLPNPSAPCFERYKTLDIGDRICTGEVGHQQGQPLQKTSGFTL